MKTDNPLLAPVNGGDGRDVADVKVNMTRAGKGRIRRVIYPAGFRWSTDMKSRVGTDFCMHAHVGFIVAGEIEIEYRDGCRVRFTAPQAVVIEPGHDGWVNGEAPAILIEVDFEGDTARQFGLPERIDTEPVAATASDLQMRRNRERLQSARASPAGEARHDAYVKVKTRRAGLTRTFDPSAWLAGVLSWRPRFRRGTLVVLKIVACALGWRALSAFAAFLSNVVFPLDQPAAFTVTQRAHYFWDALARYDAGWYFGIARNGYSYVEGGRNNLAFFPTYPVLMGHLGYAMGGGQANYYIAGLIISWLAFAGAMVLLYRLARLDLDDDAAGRACVYAAVFPFAFFFGAVYPSSLFVLLTVLTFYAFRQGHWVIGAVAGALVTCTRVNGILLWPAVALVVWANWRHDRSALRRAAVALALVPSGLVIYSAYTYALSGSLIEWALSIRRWNYHPGRWPGEVFAILFASFGSLYEFLTTRPSGPYDFLNGFAALGGAVAIPFVWRRFGAAYAVYMALNLALPLSSGEFEGLGRYTAVLFPLFLWLGTFRGLVTQAGILATFAMFYMLCQALFVTLHPIF